MSDVLTRVLDATREAVSEGRREAEARLAVVENLKMSVGVTTKSYRPGGGSSDLGSILERLERLEDAVTAMAADLRGVVGSQEQTLIGMRTVTSGNSAILSRVGDLAIDTSAQQQAHGRHVIGVIEARLDRFEQKLPQARAKIAKETKRLHEWLVVVKYRGYCPACNIAKLFCTGIDDDKVESPDWDHHVASNQQGPVATWPVCKPCHKLLHAKHGAFRQTPEMLNAADRFRRLVQKHASKHAFRSRLKGTGGPGQGDLRL